MTKEEFYHTSDIENAKSFFADNGWIPLYRSGYTEKDEKLSNWHIILGYLIDPKEVDSCLNTYSRDIEENELISVCSDNTYQSFTKMGYEPLVVVKEFLLKNGTEKRINISEELIFYFNLYEEFTDELNKTYSYIYIGEKEPVIKVSEAEVKIKQKYLLNILV